MGDETFHSAFASRRFFSNDGKREPTERECLAVLWATGHLTTYPGGSGSVKRLGGRIQEVLSELCASLHERWDEYTASASWVKHTLPDPSLPNVILLFEILFAHQLRSTLDTLVLQMDGAGTAKGLDGFLNQGWQVLREVRSALEKGH